MKQTPRSRYQSQERCLRTRKPREGIETRRFRTGLTRRSAVSELENPEKGLKLSQRTRRRDQAIRLRTRKPREGIETRPCPAVQRNPGAGLRTRKPREGIETLQLVRYRPTEYVSELENPEKGLKLQGRDNRRRHSASLRTRKPREGIETSRRRISTPNSMNVSELENPEKGLKQDGEGRVCGSPRRVSELENPEKGLKHRGLRAVARHLRSQN